MDTKNTSRQLRYLEEVRTPLHRAGFGTLPVEGSTDFFEVAKLTACVLDVHVRDPPVVKK